ncbi:MAG: hypothetical protein WA755_20155 [Candidatus Acidiferrales bacterium]
MKFAVRFAIAVFMLASLAPAGQAQRGFFRPPDMQGVWNPVVGAGGSYEIQKSGGTTTHLDLFIAGKESVAGKDGYWMEIVAGDPQQKGTFVMKTLTVIDGTNTQVSRVIMQMPGQQPMEMSQQMMAMRASNAKTADIRAQGQSLGSESITTPAGTFTCEHWRSGDGQSDVWISAKAPPYGLIKSVSKQGTTMVLVKILSDEKDRITGTPVPLNPMNMARPQQ